MADRALGCLGYVADKGTSRADKLVILLKSICGKGFYLCLLAEKLIACLLGEIPRGKLCDHGGIQVNDVLEAIVQEVLVLADQDLPGRELLKGSAH